MPLSEEEQRLLEQMEQALAADDPKFASTLRGSASAARNRRQALAGAGAFVLGVAVLMVGAVQTNTIIAVVGFLTMLGGAYLFAVAWRRVQQGAGSEETETSAAPSSPSKAGKETTGSFMDRMEERWRRRRDDGEAY
ncbi:MAG: DUF3040 domain-containing protein [Actinomycetota bacterium]|nr:DUF3040 domain-containing protein [Actinomycetota bacterium]